MRDQVQGIGIELARRLTNAQQQSEERTQQELLTTETRMIIQTKSAQLEVS